jgi:hypothetical protein
MDRNLTEQVLTYIAYILFVLSPTVIYFMKYTSIFKEVFPQRKAKVIESFLVTLFIVIGGVFVFSIATKSLSLAFLANIIRSTVELPALVPGSIARLIIRDRLSLGVLYLIVLNTAIFEAHIASQLLLTHSMTGKRSLKNTLLLLKITLQSYFFMLLTIVISSIIWKICVSSSLADKITG